MSKEKSFDGLQLPTIPTVAPVVNASKAIILQNNSIDKSQGEKLDGEWYVAMYQFDAVEPTDLSLKPGDIIHVFEAKDEWWKGTCNKKKGIFPANYVQKASALNSIGGKNICFLKCR